MPIRHDWDRPTERLTSPVNVRLRRNWLGKYIVQVECYCEHMPLPHHYGWRFYWRDMKPGDLPPYYTPS